MVPRTALLRPDRYFAERDLNGLSLAALVGGLLAGTVGLVYAIGYLLVVHINGTVLVDNPNRPPEMFCDDNSTLDSEIWNESNCDAPQQIEQNVDPIIWEAVGELAGQLLVGVVLLVGLLVLVIHAGVWITGGERGILHTLAITLWGLAPLLPAAIVSYAIMWVTVDPVTVSPGGDPRSAIEPLIGQFRALDPVTTGISLTTTLWGAIIWKFGLQHRQQLSPEAATGVAGLVGFLVALTSLV